MKKILISIKPEYVALILKESKRYEYRKIKTKDKINSMIVYSTSPVKKVVAEIEIDCIIEKSPQELWAQTHEQSGIDKEFFDQYFAGKDRAVAYKLGKINKYNKPKKLEDFNIKHAPQSFVYV